MSEKEAHYYRLYAEELRSKLSEVHAAVNKGRAEAQVEFEQGGDYLFRGRLQAYDHVLVVLNRAAGKGEEES